MNRKAIKNLAQLPDAELFDQVSEGVNLCVANAEKIFDDACCLAEQKRPRGARLLSTVAEEEASKVLILLDAVRCPRATSPDEFARQLGYFQNHLAKGIYVVASGWRPADFAEVKAGVDRERQNFYLDGPNAVDWIFDNDILRQREDAIYVGYVENDRTHVWHDPSGLDEFAFVGSTRHNQALRLVRALSVTGCLTPAALAQIAAQWRPVTIAEEMAWTALRTLNHKTLEALQGRGLLNQVPDEQYATVIDEWPFPLYTLDLSPTDVGKSSLDEIRKQWAPYA